MARPARIEYEGAFYHAMNRGNRKEDIFLYDEDRRKFYEILGNVEKRYKVILYSFVLMTNITTFSWKPLWAISPGPSSV